MRKPKRPPFQNVEQPYVLQSNTLQIGRHYHCIFNYKTAQYGYFKTIKHYEVNAFTSGHFCFISSGK